MRKSKSNKPYRLKHKRQTLADFRNDCHRFTLWYNGKETEVSCYDALSVFFDDENIPEEIRCSIQDDIYDLIDKNECKWSVPKGAQEIADAYCRENFS